MPQNPSAVPPPGGSAVLLAADRRADDHSRRVTVSPEGVAIERVHRGVAMRIGVPAEAYRGVCVGIKEARAGATYYELKLVHPDDELSVVLAEEADDRSIWADWRAWARFLDLPALVERSDGIEEWRGDGGRGGGAAVSTRRRPKRRRAPFVRRWQSSAAAPAVMHRGAEIIARN